MDNLTKRDIVEHLSNQTGLTQAEVLSIVQKTLDCIVESLAQNQNVELRNFGVFHVKIHRARVGRNPKRPETDVAIPPRATVRFRAGKVMKARVQQVPVGQDVDPHPPMMR